MKEIIAKTSSAKEIAVPWFETMGKQVGLSKRATAAILREQQLRIRKLNRVSARILSDAIKRGEHWWKDECNIYGKIACILDRCKYIPCGSGACAQCNAAKQLHYQGVSVGNSLPGHTTLNLDYLRPADDEYSSGWTANDLVERHQSEPWSCLHARSRWGSGNGRAFIAGLAGFHDEGEGLACFLEFNYLRSLIRAYYVVNHNGICALEHDVHIQQVIHVRFERGADIVSGIYTLPASGVPWWNTNFHCPFAENTQYEERRVARLTSGLTVL
jgi:hypothetical protein